MHAPSMLGRKRNSTQGSDSFESLVNDNAIESGSVAVQPISGEAQPREPIGSF